MDRRFSVGGGVDSPRRTGLAAGRGFPVDAVVEPDDAVFEFVGGDEFEALSGGGLFVAAAGVFDDGVDAGQSVDAGVRS